MPQFAARRLPWRAAGLARGCRSGRRTAEPKRMPTELLTERRDATLVLTLSDPATRNTLSEQALLALVEALDTAEADPEIRCVVLRGAGLHFCAGGNLNGLASRREQGPAAQAQMLDHLHRCVEALRSCPKPVIAAVEGAAAGAGFSLALACDLIVAADNARLVLSYARVGLTPDAGATWALAKALPRQRVQDLVWLAEPISAQELHRHGLVARVVPEGTGLDQALELAQRLASMASNALVSGKDLVNQADARSLRAQLDAEREHFIKNLFHRNGAIGLQAFFDKRAPRFD
jgi:enoyl-CoA hydratase/carnithine racemase